MARSRYNVVPQRGITIVEPQSGWESLAQALADSMPTRESKQQDALLALRNKELNAKIQSDEENALYRNKTLRLQRDEMALNEDKFKETQNQNKIINDNNLVNTFFEDRDKGYTDDEINAMNSTLGLSPNAMKMFRAKSNKLNKDYKQKEKVATAMSTLAKNTLGEDLDPVLFQNGEVSLSDIDNLWKQKITRDRTITPEKKIRLEALFKTVTELEKQRALLGDYQGTQALDNKIQGYYNQINKLTPNLDPIMFEPYTPPAEETSDSWLGWLPTYAKLMGGGGTPKKQTDQNQQLSLEDIVSGSPIGLNVSDTTGTDTTVVDTTRVDTTGTDTTSTRPDDAPDDIPDWMFDPITESADSTAQDTTRDLDSTIYNDIFDSDTTQQYNPKEERQKELLNQIQMEGDVDVPDIDYLLEELEPEPQRIKIQDRNIPKELKKFSPTTVRNIGQIKESSPISFEQESGIPKPIGVFRKEVDSLYSSIEKLNKQIIRGGGSRENRNKLKEIQKTNALNLLNLLKNLPEQKDLEIHDLNKIRLLKQFPKQKGFKDLKQMENYFLNKYNIR